MSWGERSCKKYDLPGPCGFNPTFETCNRNCEGYISNGKKPDSNISMQNTDKEKTIIKNCQPLTKNQRKRQRKKGK